MANLDTRSKRASSVGIMLAFVLAPPLPDGTLDQGDQQHIAVSYSGILAEAPVVVAPPILDCLADFEVLSIPRFSRDIIGIARVPSEILKC